MPGENKYCRPHVAAMFNKLPFTRWLPNTNPGLYGMYESGRSDGFVVQRGRMICVECKADFGSFFLGGPDKDDKQGWTAVQRNWWQKVAWETSTPYYLALWLYPERWKKQRIYQKQARLFLVPPDAWLELEAASLAGDAPSRTVALNSDLERIHARKHLTAEAYFSRYALAWVENSGWQITPDHPIQEHLEYDHALA